MDYLSKYANKGVAKFQEGGAMPEGGAPAQSGAPQGGGADVQGMLMQFAETQDPQLAVAICNELLKMMQGGGGAPAPAMEKGGRMEHTAPMFKKGGKL